MSAHTPGPWTITRYSGSSINSKTKHIAMVNFYKSPNKDVSVSGEEHEANARLIAAAPDLLDSAVALINLLMHPSLDVDESIPEIVSLQAAIEKATGKST